MKIGISKNLDGKLTRAFEKVGLAPVKRTDHFEDEHNKKADKLDDGFKQRIHHAKLDGHRLRDVFAAPLKMVADFVPPVYTKSPEEKEFITNAMKDNLTFDNMGRIERRAFIDAFEPVTFNKDAKIIRQGEKGDYAYVIHNGTVAIAVDGSNVGTVGPGEIFGELALLYDCPRAASCSAETDCRLFRVGQKTVRRLLAGYDIKGHNDTKRLLKNVSFMKGLDDRNLTKVAVAMRTMTFEEGEWIAKKGDNASMFLIVKEGKVECTDIEVGDSKYNDLTLGPGDSIGEYAIANDSPIAANVQALEKTTCLMIKKEVFLKLFGDLGALKMTMGDAVKLSAIPIHGQPKMKKTEIEALLSFVKNYQIKKNHIFFVEGIPTTTPALFLLRSGSVSVSSSKIGLGFEWLGFALGMDETKTITQGGYFGNDMINFAETGPAVPNYTATAETDCVVGALTIDAFKFVFGQKMLANEGVPFDELKMHRILGAGTFGKVWLVSKKGTKDAYALKVQNKRQLIEFGQAEGVTREKNIMARLDHPLIIKLVSSFKDENNVYMLTKLYQGGELQSVIHTDTRNGLPEWAAQFYAAGVLVGLSYMHHLHILYRDLKPENVLLDSEGYTVIVDLGFAKIVPDKTYTFCGTPIYIAPEVILQQGHDKGYDHWSWGVMLYEMIVGVTPFYDGKIDQMTLYKRIVKGKFEFPGGDFMSSSSKDLIRRILVPKPRDRLGSFAGADMDIRRHTWFDGIDWKKLERKELEVPWTPKVTDPLDGSNFTSWEHLEKESEKEKKPLSPEEQKVFDDF